MNFQRQNITITGANDTMSIAAIVGEGTGLAYHHPVLADGSIDTTTWTLSHVPSGMCIAPYGVAQEEEAQDWLEKVSHLFYDKWQCDLLHLKQRFHSHRDTRAMIETAHYDATQDDYFLYAAEDDPDYDCDYPLTESHTDAPTRDPGSPLIQTIVTGLLNSYRSATKVYFVKMTPDGQHHNIRVYER